MNWVNYILEELNKMNWTEAIINNVVLVGLIVWLGKVQLSRIASRESGNIHKDLEEHKNTLNTQLENVKGEVQKMNDFFKIRESRLYEERIMALKDIYSKLIELRFDMENLTQIWNSQKLSEQDKEDVPNVKRSGLAFAKAVFTNSIFLEKELVSDLENILKKYDKSFSSYIYNKKIIEDHSQAFDQAIIKMVSDSHQKLADVWKEVTINIPQLEEKMRESVRQLIDPIQETQ